MVSALPMTPGRGEKSQFQFLIVFCRFVIDSSSFELFQPAKYVRKLMILL